MVGLAVVAQQTPLSVTVAPPLEVMFPPDDAEFTVTLVIAVVVKAGRLAFVVNDNSFP
jgi:hypothetical protein